MRVFRRRHLNISINKWFSTFVEKVLIRWYWKAFLATISPGNQSCQVRKTAVVSNQENRKLGDKNRSSKIQNDTDVRTTYGKISPCTGRRFSSRRNNIVVYCLSFQSIRPPWKALPGQQTQKPVCFSKPDLEPILENEYCFWMGSLPFSESVYNVVYNNCLDNQVIQTICLKSFSINWPN